MSLQLYRCPKSHAPDGHVFYWLTREACPRCTLCGWPLVIAGKDPA
jgi:hypothetical protein